MKKPKVHKIRNFNDFFKVATLENYDRITSDFLILFYNLLRAKETMTEEELKSIKLPYFEWSDDNENRLGYKFDKLGDIYFEKKKECSHYDENDNSAFYYDGHDSHHRYYKCKLCGFEKEI